MHHVPNRILLSIRHYNIGNISMTESLLSRKTGVAAVMRIIKTCKPDGNYELENKWFNLLLWGLVT